ncbi:hypothetical protein INT46_003436 [Mucor plumbeus]|uniref:Uncharacterized protein n=1 Tax=Mucor plumbeus TaxID=97098 RepID=A0A8H7QNA9_9FUNG|nr:hypothetical protein INT46_003436 [Mucor plumbeus]
MTPTLPYDVQDSIKSLLLRNTLLCSIKKMYPTVGMVNLSNLNGLRGAQEYLRSTSISMSLSGAEKLLNVMGFKAKKKQDQFCQCSQQKTQTFSGKTRVNIGGSDSEFLYWSDVSGTNRPLQVRPQVQGIGDGVMFWGCISGDEPGYNKILDWPPQNSDLKPIEHIWGNLKRHLDAYPNRPATK